MERNLWLVSSIWAQYFVIWPKSKFYLCWCMQDLAGSRPIYSNRFNINQEPSGTINQGCLMVSAPRKRLHEIWNQSWMQVRKLSMGHSVLSCFSIFNVLGELLMGPRHSSYAYRTWSLKKTRNSGISRVLPSCHYAPQLSYHHCAWHPRLHRLMMDN